MESVFKKVANLFRYLAWLTDYSLFLIFSPFKFKRQPSAFMSILVVELLYLGDVISIVPALRALKKKYPDAKLTVMLRPEMRDVLSGVPFVDGIITFSRSDFIFRFSRVVKSIRGLYDLAVILHPGTDIGSWKVSSLLCKAGIPFRVGSTRVGFLEGKGFFFHRNTKPSFRLKHKIEDNLDVIRVLGIGTDDKRLELYTTPDSDAYMEKLLRKNRVLPADFLVVVHASPRHKSHLWLDERFAKLADSLVERYNAKVVFSGSIPDFVLNSRIIHSMGHRAVNLAGLTDVKQLFSLVRRANLVVSVDTGIMHVAAALNTPVVALFGAGNPKIWRPYSGNSLYIFKDKEVCTSCMKHRCKRDMDCMRAIGVEDVLEKIRELLGR